MALCTASRPPRLTPADALRPVGADEPDEASVYRNNPQIARLLATHLQALVVGHDRAGAIAQRLPAAPPHIHAFVYCCDDADVRAFTEQLDYLHLLATANVPAIDEVIAASVRLAAEGRADADDFRQRAAPRPRGGACQRRHAAERDSAEHPMTPDGTRPDDAPSSVGGTLRVPSDRPFDRLRANGGL